MRKTYFKNPFYYPDNKDIYDFLAGTVVNRSLLLQFLAGYGIFPSHRETDQSIYEFVSSLSLDWEGYSKLVDLASVRDSQDKWARSEHEFSGGGGEMLAAIQDVRENRSFKEKEQYNIECAQDGKIRVTVTYLDTNPAKSRLFQQVEKDLVIEVDPRDSGFGLRYSSNDRARAVVANLLGYAGKRAEDKSISSWEVNLSDILDPTTRVLFFDEMLRRIEGFETVDVLQVKVDRLPDKIIEEEVDDGDSEDAVDTEEVEVIGERLKKVIFYGENLLQTPEYDALIKRGFFISSATWQAEPTAGLGDRIEFWAGFQDSLECRGFEYRVVGRYSREDGNVKTTRENVPQSDVRKYLVLVERAAKAADEIIRANPT